MTRKTSVGLIVISVCIFVGAGCQPTQAIETPLGPTESPTDIPTMIASPQPIHTTTPDFPPTPNPVGGGSGYYAFTSDQDGDHEIFIGYIGLDELTNLTNSYHEDLCPTWSPDGEQVAFLSDRGTGWGIYVMSAEGGYATRVTSIDVWMYCPVFTPDGSRIVFSAEFDGDYELYMVNVDGSDVRQLTSNTDFDIQPNISPDGEFIAYTRGLMDGNGFQIYRMRLDGSEVTRLSYTGTNFNQYPVWSPDGSRIAFMTNTNSEFEINIMNSDGSAPESIFDTSNPIGEIVWSPDGEWLLFAMELEHGSEIILIRTDSSEQLNLTQRPGDDRDPEWIP